MTWPPRARACLGDRVGDYVEGALPADEQLDWDRHLVACASCRGAADLERRLRATLRSAPAVPDDLRALLLSVSQEIPISLPAPRRSTAGDGGRPIPRVPRPGPDLGLVVLGEGAPAQHRSALRAALFATAAAGASAAAVWGMSVAPAASTSARLAPATLPVRPASERPTGATGWGASVLVVDPVVGRSRNGAQSSP